MNAIEEIRVRPVVRWIVTRYVKTDAGSSVATIGEFDNEYNADEVARALQLLPPAKTVGVACAGLTAQD